MTRVRVSRLLVGSFTAFLVAGGANIARADHAAEQQYIDSAVGTCFDKLYTTQGKTMDRWDKTTDTRMGNCLKDYGVDSHSYTSEEEAKKSGELSGVEENEDHDHDDNGDDHHSAFSLNEKGQDMLMQSMQQPVSQEYTTQTSGSEQGGGGPTVIKRYEPQSGSRVIKPTRSFNNYR